MFGINCVILTVTLMCCCGFTSQGIIPSDINFGDMPGGLHQLCPVVDCLPLISYLQCDYQDTYVQTMELYGSVCPGCPVCRDYSYFQQLSKDLTQQLDKAKDKINDEKEVLNKNKFIVERIQHIARDGNIDSGTDQEQLKYLLADNLKQLESILSNSGIIKSIRYMTENYEELGAILNYGTFLEARLDLNVDGYFENTFSHVILSFDDIPYYEQHRYDKILQDYNLDKVAQLQRQTGVFYDIITDLFSQMVNITSVNEEKYEIMKKSSPLMLRRTFQLMESNKGSLHVYLNNKMDGISNVTESLHKVVENKPGAKKGLTFSHTDKSST